MRQARKLLDRLAVSEKPLRYLARRIVQAIAESATANFVLGSRSAPGGLTVVRLTRDDAEREEWERQYAESRPAILAEVEREVQARELKLRGPLQVELLCIAEQALDTEESAEALAGSLEPEQAASVRARLPEEREVILTHRARTLLLDTEPPGAQAYLDNRPAGVTPCRVEDVSDGEHLVGFSLRGYLLHEERVRVRGPARQGSAVRVTLQPEPEMGVLEVRTFPPNARVTVGGETRQSPATFRVPAGSARVVVELADFRRVEEEVAVRHSADERPQVHVVRLEYDGADREEVVGRLLVYDSRAPSGAGREDDAPAAAIRSFFADDDPAGDLGPWQEPAWPEPAGGVLGERPLRRGILLIGRDDESAQPVPDVRLFDAENSVSRGCHAWLWIYADRSTGAEYNTFLIGSNSPAGVTVDGELVTGTRRLSDDSLVGVGNFTLRFVKEIPRPRVVL